MRHKGITLLEVVIVIAIIAVLAGIIIFSLRPTDVFSDSKNSKRKADKESIQKGINSYVSENKVYPSSFSGLSEGIYDICRQGHTGCTVTSVNLDELVSYGVLSKIPVDPDCTSLTDTCYNLQYIPATSEYVVLITGESPVLVPTITPVPSASATPTPPSFDTGNPTAECIMYGIDDNNEDSQLFSLNLNTGSFNNIGSQLIDYGLEGMDNLANGDLYAVSYTDVPISGGGLTSQLFKWDKATGAATRIGGIHQGATQLQKIESASVRPTTNQLWVYSKLSESLYTVDVTDASATLEWAVPSGQPDNWHAIAWNPAGTELYAIDDGYHLIRWNGVNTITTLCNNLFSVETDGLEFTSDGKLIAGISSSNNLVMVDYSTCTLQQFNYPQVYGVDVESMAFEPNCGPVTPTKCYAVSASIDDAEEVLGSGSMTLTGTTLDLGRIDSGQLMATGLRFNNIELNQGETITSANLVFTANGSSSGSVNLQIHGHKIPNAPVFTTTANNISSRTSTTATVAWTGLPSWTDNSTHITPDLSSIVQEIVNQPTWASNNSLALIVTGNTAHRDASSYNQAFAESPELCITTSSAPNGTIDADIVVNGINDNDATGNTHQVLSVGDLNRDTYTDFVIGAPLAEDAGTDRGRVYVVLGSASIPASINAESASIVINGTNDGDQFGYSVSALADVNDDGKDDIIVGAPFAEDTGTNRGRVYVFYGGSSMPSSINAENANIIINGTNDGDQFGFAVSGARDVNDDPDDADEILVGAPFAQDSGSDRGRVYMIYGAKTMSATIDAENSSVIINGTNDGDQFGYSVNAVEDINNDPYYDFVVGAPFAEDAGTNRGRAYLFYGASGLSSSINAENANIIINGTNDGDQFGYSVAGVGDVDNDSYDDITIGAPYAEDSGTDRGRVYAMFGGAGLPATKNAESLDVIINGTDDNDQFGASVGEAGDIDNDGKNDISVGAPLAEDGGVNRGIAYVFYGDSNIASSINAENADFMQAGIADNDQLGKSVSAKGDLNKDGKDDLIVSAPQDQDTGTDRGRIYIFLSL